MGRVFRSGSFYETTEGSTSMADGRESGEEGRGAGAESLAVNNYYNFTIVT
jgi:hypothetical protein